MTKSSPIDRKKAHEAAESILRVATTEQQDELEHVLLVARALLVAEEELAIAHRLLEMTCEQEPCGECCGCDLAAKVHAQETPTGPSSEEAPLDPDTIERLDRLRDQFPPFIPDE